MLNKNNIMTMIILIMVITFVTLIAEMLGVRLYQRIVTNMLISLILVLGLQCFMGNSGILSFAHIGFMGIGAYTSAILTIPERMKGMALPDLYPMLEVMQLSPYISIFIAGFIAAIVAAAISFPLMRLSDAAAVITSFALLVVIYTVLNHWSALTNGPRTLFGIPRVTNIWLAYIFALFALICALLFKESDIGKLLRATRDDEIAAAAMGVNVAKTRWIGFIFAAFLAGIGGALWGHFIGSFAPKSFYLKETFVVLSMLVIGGPLTVTGAVIGTLVVTLLFESLRSFETSINEMAIFSSQIIGLTEIVLALAMIVVLIFRPGGLANEKEVGAYILKK